MQNSVTLAQLPYTGFDYGQTYNSLYWVALLIWSLVIAFIIVRNKAMLAKLFAGLAKVFIIERKTRRRIMPPQQKPEQEPVVLAERVVKFDPLVDPIAAKSKELRIRNHESELDIHNSRFVTQDTDMDPLIKSHVGKYERAYDTQEVSDRVRELVDKEIAVSRVGQTPDEFSSDDFGTVDFDGVNPDDSWVARPKRAEYVSPVKEASHKIVDKNYESQIMNNENVQTNINPKQEPLTKATQPHMPQPKITKIYQDSITLDKDSEFPKIVLSREDVTNY